MQPPVFSKSSALLAVLCQSGPAELPEMLLTHISPSVGHAGLGSTGAGLALGTYNLSITGPVSSTAWEHGGGVGGYHQPGSHNLAVC